MLVATQAGCSDLRLIALLSQGLKWSVCNMLPVMGFLMWVQNQQVIAALHCQSGFAWQGYSSQVLDLQGGGH